MALAMGLCRDPHLLRRPTGEVRRHHLHETVIQRAIRRAGIAARIFIHSALNWRVSAFVALYGELRLGWPRPRAESHMRIFWEPNDVWTTFARDCRAMDFGVG